MPAHLRQYLVGIAVHNGDMDSGEAIARALFDHLQILPVGLGLLEGWWTSPASVVRNLSPGVDQGGAIVAFAISRHRRWRIRMPTLLQVSHQVVRHLLLRLANRASDP